MTGAPGEFDPNDPVDSIAEETRQAVLAAVQNVMVQRSVETPLWGWAVLSGSAAATAGLALAIGVDMPTATKLYLEAVGQAWDTTTDMAVDLNIHRKESN